MKAKTPKTSKAQSYAGLEKILTIAGLILIVVGCVANLYGAYVNLRFIRDPIDVIYYLRYALMLSGGFAIGYWLRRKSPRVNQADRLFLAVAYAVLALAFYWLFDLARFGLQSLTNQLLYPWGKLVFEGIPLLSVLASLVVAYVWQFRPQRSSLSSVAKLVIILSFIIYQVYMLVSGPIMVLLGQATYTPGVPLWLTLVSYLTIPLLIAAAAYLVFGGVKSSFDRLFYAVLVGMLYSSLTMVLWEFRTDATSEATNIFSNIVTAIDLIYVGLILWRARHAIK